MLAELKMSAIIKLNWLKMSDVDKVHESMKRFEGFEDIRRHRLLTEDEKHSYLRADQHYRKIVGKSIEIDPRQKEDMLRHKPRFEFIIDEEFEDIKRQVVERKQEKEDRYKGWLKENPSKKIK